ncbi:unnamed protein product, partial [Musa hybrid cultivar]
LYQPCHCPRRQGIDDVEFFALLTSSCFAILPMEIFSSKVVLSILIGTLTLYVALKTMSSPLSSVLPVARL